MSTRIVCDTFKGFRVEEIQVAKRGLALLETWINSQDFIVAINHSKFTGTKMGQAEIISRILSGSDDMDKRVDYQINLAFSMYYRWWSRVVGWVTPGVRVINVNRKYFGLSREFAANAIHEYCHMCGFDHSSATDYGSVPYKIGNLFLIWCDSKGY